MQSVPQVYHLTYRARGVAKRRQWQKQGGVTESLGKIRGYTFVKTTLDEYGTEALEEVQENYQKVMAEMF